MTEIVEYVEYHVVYGIVKNLSSGVGSIIVHQRGTKITQDTVSAWVAYISKDLDGAEIVILNWIKLDKV